MYMKKYDNFLSTLVNLQEIYKYEEPYGKVELTGLVGLYEVCFEQSWKALKEILEDNGFEESRTGSPKMIIKTAFKAGIINDEELWLTALNDRNNVAHSYNEAIALEIVRNTKAYYYEMFCAMKKEVETNWLF